MLPYPLVFTPILKPKIWGGRRLETILHKPLPPDQPIGESWEIADLEDDQSVVANGPAAGMKLEQLVRQWGSDLVGPAELFDGRFPLLIKFLDAAENLSVQVHPDEAMARRLGGRVRPKHEAWYVVAAEPGAAIYRGLVAGVTRDDFRRAVAAGTVERLLRRIEVRPGECYYLPSGTVHALGAGVLVAEVQTPSDVTYRVFDWNRLDPATGQPRELHIERALECIHFDAQDEPAPPRTHLADMARVVTRLASCEFFTIDKVRAAEGFQAGLEMDGMRIWMLLAGAIRLSCGALPEPLELGVGAVVLIPAALKEARVEARADCVWLEVAVPARPRTG